MRVMPKIGMVNPTRTELSVCGVKTDLQPTGVRRECVCCVVVCPREVAACV